MAADDIGLTGLWFHGQRYFARGLSADAQENALPVFFLAKQWLDCYFTGQIPHQYVPVHLIGTVFQRRVWQALNQIPYGQITTYASIAKQLCLSRESARAVGGAVGKNPISIIIPCHRVIGANNTLTGYAGGTDKKASLLSLEGIHIEE